MKKIVSLFVTLLFGCSLCFSADLLPNKMRISCKLNYGKNENKKYCHINATTIFRYKNPDGSYTREKTDGSCSCFNKNGNLVLSHEMNPDKSYILSALVISYDPDWGTISTYDSEINGDPIPETLNSVPNTQNHRAYYFKYYQDGKLEMELPITNELFSKDGVKISLNKNGEFATNFTAKLEGNKLTGECVAIYGHDESRVNKF